MPKLYSPFQTHFAWSHQIYFAFIYGINYLTRDSCITWLCHAWSGAYPGGRRPGAQWVTNFGALNQSWRMASSPSFPPTTVNLAPLKFSSLEPLQGAPACAWMAPYSPGWFIFFPFPPFFLSVSFLFLLFIGAPLVTRGAKAPKAPQDTPLHDGMSAYGQQASVRLIKIQALNLYHQI